jgi:hypothetical protein
VRDSKGKRKSSRERERGRGLLESERERKKEKTTVYGYAEIYLDGQAHQGFWRRQTTMG